MFLLFFVGIGWLAPAPASAQIDKIDQVLKTKKAKKKPKKKKLKRKKKSDGKEVDELGIEPPRIDFGPGSFGRKDGMPLPPRTIPKKQKEEKVLTRRQKNRTKGGAKGTTFSGNRPPTYSRPPGQVYEEPRSRDVDLATELSGTQDPGLLKRKKSRIQQPGQIYNSKDRAKLAKKQRNQGTNYAGDRPLPLGRKPGEVYEEPRGRDVDNNTELYGTRYGGNIKVVSQKGNVPGTHWKDRKVHATETGTYQGTIKVTGRRNNVPGTHWQDRKVKETETGSYQGRQQAMSKRKKARYYGDISQRQQQYEGNLKVKKIKHDNLHPSAAYRVTYAAKSQDQVEKARNRSRLLNNLFRKKEQPPHVKEKKHKPRYSKEESEIWTQ